MEHLVQSFAGYSCADISNVCRDASFMAMRKLISGLNKQQIVELNLGMRFILGGFFFFFFAFSPFFSGFFSFLSCCCLI
jgi:hypothetical protein